MATTLARIEFRRKTAAQWTSSNEVLLASEPGVETDTGKFKLGDGTTGWSSLPYQAGTAASLAATYAIKRPEVYYVSQQGLAGDWVGNDASGTGTNDTSALQTLLTSAADGSTIVFDRFKRYRIDPVSYSGKSLTIDFNDCTIITKTMSAGTPSTGAPFLRVSGSIGSTKAISVPARGDSTITTTTPADAGGFAAGDYIGIGDASTVAAWDTATTAWSTGFFEVNQVVSVNSSTGAINLTAPLSIAYPTSPTVAKLTPVKAPKVRNIATIYDTDPGVAYTGSIETTAPHLFYFQYCIDPVIENVTAKGWQLHVANFYRCVRPRGSRVTGDTPFRPTSGGHGYVARFFQSVDGEVDGFVGIATRHVVDHVNAHRCGSRNCKAYNQQNASFETHGLMSSGTYSRNDTVVGGTAGVQGWSHGDPTFNADLDFTIDSPTHRGNAGAVISRSRSTGLTVRNPNTYNTQGLAQVCEGAGQAVVDASAGRAEIIAGTSNARWVISRPEAASGNTQVAWPGDVTVIGPNFYGPGTFSFNNTGAVKMLDTDNQNVSLTQVGPGSSLARPTHLGRPPAAGNYWLLGNVLATNNSHGVGTLRMYQIYVSRTIVVSKIGAEITANGDTGCTVRLGIYQDGGNELPTALVVDAGTIAGDSTGVKEITLGSPVTLKPGFYWVGGVVQGVTTTQPTIRALNAPLFGQAPFGNTTPATAQVTVGVGVLGITGALPSTVAPTSATSGTAPRIFMFVSG